MFPAQGSLTQVQVTCYIFSTGGGQAAGTTPYSPQSSCHGDYENKILDSQLLSQPMESVRFHFYVLFPHLDFKLLKQGLLVTIREHGPSY